MEVEQDAVSQAQDSVDHEIQLLMTQSQNKGEGKGQEKGKGTRGRPKKRSAEEATLDPDGSAPVAKAAPKKRQKFGVSSCKGCKKKITPEEQAANFPGCKSCKRALDNISKLAARQGKEAVAFFKEQRDDPDKCFSMVQSYMALCPECAEGAKNKKRGTWSVAKYQERVVAASGFVKDKVGEMMGKKLFIEFAQTVRGGRKTDDQALAQWAYWETRIAAGDPEIFSDYLGENSSLRIWVHTGDEMRFRTSYFQEKSVNMEGETKKNASQADIERMKNKVTSKHDPIADQIQVCQALARNGEAAFQNNDGFLLDIMDLAGAAEKAAETPAEEQEDPDNTSPEKTKPWVDRDRVISATVRSCESQIKVFKTKCESGLQDCRKALSEYKANPDQLFQKNFAGEIKILENRVEALGIVMDQASVVPSHLLVSHVFGRSL